MTSLQLSGYQDSDARLKGNDFFQTNPQHKLKVFGSYALVEKIKLVLTFEDECGFGDKSI